MEKRTKYFPNKEAVCENCPFPLYSPPQGKNANNSFDPKSNTLLLDVIGNSLKKEQTQNVSQRLRPQINTYKGSAATLRQQTYLLVLCTAVGNSNNFPR